MRMTANRRIALNIAATYVRSAYALVCGLLAGRWLLLSLGRTDYGLLGVVGALLGFVTFLNRSMSASVQRFYTVAIGRSQRRGKWEEGLAECRRWFTVAVSLHTAVPLFLVAVGYPIGVCAIFRWLVIPPDRVEACVWVWRFTCISSLIGMLNVPFRAMYHAKQEIAELTLCGVADTTLNVLLLYYMVTHPGDWLAKYAMLHCLIVSVIRIALCISAILRFPQCRIVSRHLWNWADIRELSSFAGWALFVLLGRLARNQGMAILVNKYFGPAQNAAWSVANRLAGRSNRFSASTVGSFSPAIITAKGAGKDGRALSLAFRVSKLGSLIVAAVSIPLAIEVSEVMRIWLKHPPAESPALCVCVVVVLFLQKLSSGLYISISASGRIARSSALTGLLFILTLPLAAFLVECGFGMNSIGISLVATTVLAVLVRLYYANLYGVPAVRWCREVCLPVLAAVSLAVAAGFVPRLFMDRSPLRVAFTIVLCECALCGLSWFVALTADERQYVAEKIRKALAAARSVLQNG